MIPFNHSVMQKKYASNNRASNTDSRTFTDKVVKTYAKNVKLGLKSEYY